MANQNIDGGVADNVENGSSATQEVSSTTPVVEISKRSLRVQTWKKFQDNKVGVTNNSIFNRIPRFVDGEKAAENFVNTDEFKNAQHIKINMDRALHAAKLPVLQQGKNLYLPATKDSSALYLKVDVAADTTDEQKKDILHSPDVQSHRTEISLDNKVPLDLVLIGSVIVSRDGYRIGRGNGFTDLDIGLLIELGSITPNTVIATMVHDVQVVDDLPTNLFQKYDTPVDLIITPTQVIRVQKRLPRPTGIFWELLSERRLKLVPVLAKLRDQEREKGKEITLKEYDTDIEQFQNNRSRRRGPIRRRFSRRINQRRAQSQTDNEQRAGENNNQQQQQQQQQQRRYNQGRPRRYTNRRRRTTKSEGDHSGVEGGKSQERKQGRNAGGGNGNFVRRRRQRRTRAPQRDFCIKLSNLSRDVRVKDIKTELRRRECQPLFISWKGQFGKCYLHFGNRDGTPSTDDDIDKVMKSLADLTLTVNVGGSEDNKTVATTNEANTEETTADATVIEQSENAANTEETTADATVIEQSENAARTKTVNVNVELIKYKENADGKNAAVADTPTANGGTEQNNVAGGDAADDGRIESVDTTTV